MAKHEKREHRLNYNFDLVLSVSWPWQLSSSENLRDLGIDKFTAINLPDLTSSLMDWFYFTLSLEYTSCKSDLLFQLHTCSFYTVNQIFIVSDISAAIPWPWPTHYDEIEGTLIVSPSPITRTSRDIREVYGRQKQWFFGKTSKLFLTLQPSTFGKF